MNKLDEYFKENKSDIVLKLKLIEFNSILKDLADRLNSDGDYSNSFNEIILNLTTIRDVCKIVRPKNILEIGFNRGASATMWLLHSKAKLTSIDTKIPKVSVNTLNKNFKDRLSTIEMNSQDIIKDKPEWIGSFDLVFIDGDHRKEMIVKDINTALKLNPKYILFDDYYHIAHMHEMQRIINEYVKENIIEIIKNSYHMQCLVKVIERKE